MELLEPSMQLSLLVKTCSAKTQVWRTAHGEDANPLTTARRRLAIQQPAAEGSMQQPDRHQA
jgi:hypothetical protein